MTLAVLPPKTEEMIDENKYPTLNWGIFFEALASGDAGTTWTPNFVGLTETGGTATKTGIYYRLSDKLVFYRVVITPVTSTSAVNGTTYCDNFPLAMASDGFNVTCSGFTAATAGTTYSDKRIYTATWTAITTPIVIVGIAEVR